MYPSIDNISNTRIRSSGCHMRSPYVLGGIHYEAGCHPYKVQGEARPDDSGQNAWRKPRHHGKHTRREGGTCNANSFEPSHDGLLPGAQARATLALVET